MQEPPHGQCGSVKLAYFSDYSKDNCLLECSTNHTVETCGCKFHYMPGDEPVCTLELIDTCDTFLLDSFRSQPSKFNSICFLNDKIAFPSFSAALAICIFFVE